MSQAAGQRPKSPTELLWAYQIKREHAHLLARVQTLEAAQKAYDARIEDLRSSDIDALNVRISGLATKLEDALSDKDLLAALKANLDRLQAETATMATQLSRLRDASADAEEERRHAGQREKAMLKRVAELEASVNKYKSSLKQLKENIDAQQSFDVDSAVARVKEDVKRANGTGLTELEARVAVIERANSLLNLATEKNRAMLGRMANTSISNKHTAPKAAPFPRSWGKTYTSSSGRPIAPPTIPQGRNQATKPLPQSVKQQNHKPSPLRKKPGNAPRHNTQRDDSYSDDESSEDARFAHPNAGNLRRIDSAGSVQFLVRKDGTTERPKGTACKPCARAHKRCTCGFSKDDLAASQNRWSYTKSEPKSAEKTPKPQPVPRKRKSEPQFESHKPIIRKGKGWFEIERTPSPEEDSDDELVHAQLLDSVPPRRKSVAEHLHGKEAVPDHGLVPPDQARLTRAVLHQHEQNVNTLKRPAPHDGVKRGPGRPRKNARSDLNSAQPSPAMSAPTPGAMAKTSRFSSSAIPSTTRRRASAYIKTEPEDELMEAIPPRRRIVQVDSLSMSSDE